MNMSQYTPAIFDRDRPLTWNLLGFISSRSKYGVGNEWRHFEQEDGSLECEECGFGGDERFPDRFDRAVMIVNDPFDPEEPVNFSEPTQVRCADCVESELPIDSEYRDGVKSGSTADLTVEDLDTLNDALTEDAA